MKLPLPVGRPQNGPVEQTAVFKAVGQAGDIDATARAVLVHRKMDLPVPLQEHLCALQGVHIPGSMAEVGLPGAVGQDKVIRVLLPVILVVAQG